VVVSAILFRKQKRLQMRVTLGTARPGDLVELAAALATDIILYLDRGDAGVGARATHRCTAACV